MVRLNALSDGIKRVGIRANIYTLMAKDGQFARMDTALQFSSSTHGSGEKTSGITITRRVNNVLTLYT